MAIFNSYFWANPPLLSANLIDFSARVEYTTLYYRPRNLVFGFSECSLDSGFYQLTSLDPDDVASLTIRDCYLGARSQGRAFDVLMEADTVDAGVSWSTHGVTILNCWFRGGSVSVSSIAAWRPVIDSNRVS